MSRSSAVAVTIAAVMILLSVVHHGSFQESEGRPTVEDCEGHIQAAIRDFVSAGQSSTADDGRTRDEESGEVLDVQAQHDDEQNQEIDEIIQLEHHDDNDDENNSSEEKEAEDNDKDSKSDSKEDVSGEESSEAGVEVVDADAAADPEEQHSRHESGGEESEESEEPDDLKEREFQEIKVNDDDDDDDDESDDSQEQKDTEAGKENDDDSSEAEAEATAAKDDVTSSEEESATRNRRDADSSETHAEQSEAGDTSDEEGTIEGSDAASVTETSDDGAGHPSTEQSDDAADNLEAAEEEEESNDDVDEVVVAGPGELKSRDKVEAILGSSASETSDINRERVANEILKDVKKMYENAVKPLEQLYKFKDISNRHMGDAEIFSKPMILFMGPWSTGKSAIINYLLGTEYSRSALKTGAEPTSNTFTMITYGETDQVLDGTQIAADWAFSTLQKFGETFLDRLKGRKLSNRLLQKMTIVDTPGVIENRKSPAERQRYPFNDAFQWFIDRADLIYVVFDPSKLDVGLELEALFDQLKGRESHVRILLNKADTVKPRELMKVQGTLLWNLSPEMSTSEAPTVFVGSFWSRPYLPGSPVTLLDAQEDAFLEDLADALESRVETKVALARRHAVRVRNHAKIVDCYLKTYYDHKSFFGNRRKVADDIIDNPHEYHIYEGLSTMTNVSRYDLPDPDVYREFFRLHPLFDFKPLASTCSYFKGCPLDKLDIVIAYDLPELVSKYQKLLGASATAAAGSTSSPVAKGSPAHK